METKLLYSYVTFFILLEKGEDMSLFEDDVLKDRSDDDLVSMAMAVRYRTLERAVGNGKGLENTMDNRMLLNDISDGAMKRIKLGQNEKALDNAAQNAALVINVLDSINGNNPFVGSTGVGTVINAALDTVCPDKIDPDTLSLGNTRLSLEDAGISEEHL